MMSCPVFQSLPFEEAIHRARRSGVWVIVLATRESSGECDIMERTTWNNEEVVAWIRANALAISFDVDAEGELTKTLDIATVPTMIAFQAGVEKRRLVGLRGWPELLIWFNGLETDISGLDGSPLVTETDVGARRSLAQALFRDGKHEEATDRYVWLWNNMTRVEPEWEGVRASFMAAEIEDLVRVYPPARERFAKMREEIATAANLSPESVDLRRDWVVLNSVLGDDDRTIVWFDAVKGDPRFLTLLRPFARLLVEPLKLRGRWADLGRLYSDPMGELTFQYTIAATSVPAAPGILSYDALNRVSGIFVNRFRSEAADLCASLRAAGRTKEASEVHAEALRLDPSDEMRNALTLAIGRSN